MGKAAIKKVQTNSVGGGECKKEEWGKWSIGILAVYNTTSMEGECDDRKVIERREKGKGERVRRRRGAKQDRDACGV